MSLPDTIPVKLSSEAAESITLTPVVVRQMPLRELVGMVLAVIGKDAARTSEFLRRGGLVAGGSRLRWQGFDASPDAIESLLATFPDPDPSRPFSAQLCVAAVLGGPLCRIEVSREAGAARRLWQRDTFWDALIESTRAVPAEYAGYSYSAQADRYRFRLSRDAADRLRERAGAIKYSGLESQVRRAAFEWIEFLVARGA